MKYFFYKDSGEITRTGETSNISEKSALLVEGESVGLGDANPETQYYSDGLIDKPPKPHELAVFDYTAKQWTTPINDVVRAKLAQISTIYNAICQGTYNGKDIYVDCLTANGTYRMNAGREAATNMDGGVRIFEGMGASYMPVVRDFYNTNHVNVPMVDAKSISVQQGADALTLWQIKGQLIDQINACTTVAEVRAIEISFPVNVLEE